MVTLYNAVSSDGFIATKDGKEDFIPDSFWNDFVNQCKEYDVVVMGRKTYEAIQEYGKEYISGFESLPIKKVIVSTTPTFNPKEGYVKVSTPQEALKLGTHILLSSGPTLNTAFYNSGNIDKVILNTVPIELGEGIPVFNIQPKLELVSEENKIKVYNVIK